MAKRKTTNKTNQIANSAVALADYAAKAYIIADDLRIKTKPVKPFPLDEDERATLAEIASLPANLKKKLAKKAAAFTIAEVISMVMAISESIVEAEPKQQVTVLGIAKKLLNCLLESIVMPDELVKAKKPKSDLLFQFKITLLDIKPAIWRRIQIPDCTLAELHEYIQAAFGWEDCHLHVFKIDGVEYSQPPPDGDDFNMDFEDETDVLLSKLLPKSAKKKRWIYEYDFGDDWQHEILFEGFPPIDPKAKYPLCLEGERACPPEDCGGPWGYVDYLAAIADPKHEQHEEMLEWRGPFDSEKFDPKKATKEMRKVK